MSKLVEQLAELARHSEGDDIFKYCAVYVFADGLITILVNGEVVARGGTEAKILSKLIQYNAENRSKIAPVDEHAPEVKEVI